MAAISAAGDLLDALEVRPLQYGDIVEGRVIAVQKHELSLDIGDYGVGIVNRRELVNHKELSPGDLVTASVMVPESMAGYVILSLRRALKNKGWEELQRLYDNKESIAVTAYDVNRGGLLIELNGVNGFLPASHLSAEHYPRGINRNAALDRDAILQKLQQLVGVSLRVCVLDLDRKSKNVIFSEKEALKEVVAQKIAEMKVGDVVEGVVTAVPVRLGAFVNVQGVEGLVHISEMSWERVEDPRKLAQEGEKIKVKIISIDNIKNQISLSMRQLTVDPWLEESEKLAIGDKIEGTVTRVTIYGAFVRLNPTIEALIRTGEMVSDKTKGKVNPEHVFKTGDKHRFTIIDIDRNKRQIALSMKR